MAERCQQPGGAGAFGGGSEGRRGILTARPGPRGPLTELTADLLSTGRLAGIGQLTGPDLTFRRPSCCLFYRTPAGTKCGTCLLAR
ncbi:(2Fe-2S)-binding protein [Streptomyces xiangluensis]|uniref:(2Fe-2S)-binding protein n=1 Tax=Streptomyces xiangluensis TaxID=2665720 RepID=A0ABV8YD79_9ACTN